MNGGVTFGDTNVQVLGTVSGAETWYFLSAKTYSPATYWSLRAYLCPQVVAHAGRTFCDPRTSCGDTNGDTCTLVLYVFGCQNLAEIG